MLSFKPHDLSKQLCSVSCVDRAVAVDVRSGQIRIFDRRKPDHMPENQRGVNHVYRTVAVRVSV